MVELLQHLSPSASLFLVLVWLSGAVAGAVAGAVGARLYMAWLVRRRRERIMYELDRRGPLWPPDDAGDAADDADIDRIADDADRDAAGKAEYRIIE